MFETPTVFPVVFDKGTGAKKADVHYLLTMKTAWTLI